MWLQDTKRNTPLFLNGIEASYRKLFKFEDDLSATQRIELETIINEKKVLSKVSTNMSFLNFEDSVDFDYNYGASIVELCTDEKLDSIGSCSQNICDLKIVTDNNLCQRTCNRCGPLAQRFNQLLVCGKNDWKLGKNRLNTKRCNDRIAKIIPAVNSSFSDLQVIEADTMYLARRPASDSNLRPAFADRTLPFKKLTAEGTSPVGVFYAPEIVSLKDSNIKTVESLKLLDDNTGSYKTETYVKYQANWYKSFKIEFYFDYSLTLSSKIGNEKTFDIDIIITKDSIGKAYSKYIADQEVCERRDWDDTKVKVISGNYCDQSATPLPKIGDKAFSQILFIGDEKLKIGAFSPTKSLRKNEYRNLTYKK